MTAPFHPVEELNLCTDSPLEYMKLIGNEVLPHAEWNDTLQQYCQEDTLSTGQFIDRYDRKILKVDFSFEDYINNKDIQDTLDVFDIDSEKFWYALLFAVDYVEGYCRGSEIGKSAKEELDDFMNIITENITSKGNTYSFKRELEVTLKVKGTRHKTLLTSPVAMAYLLYLYNKDLYGKELDDSAILNRRSLYLEKKSLASHTAQIAEFTDIMSSFLEHFTANRKKLKAYTKVSANKMLFISKLVYLVKFSNDSRFLGYDEQKGKPCLDYLRNYIKRYKGRKSQVFNHYYGF